MKILSLDEQSKDAFLELLSRRSPEGFQELEDRVADIIRRVRLEGDDALFDLTKRFDGVSVDETNLKVDRKITAYAYDLVDAEFVRIMKQAADNIRAYHEKQKRNTWIDTKADGSILGQRILPLSVSGVYVPGGKAAYPSSVLMNIVPAKVAGVERIIMTTPPNTDPAYVNTAGIAPATLVAADIAGADEIYRVGGAQAIAAMAFGTKSIPKVDKITGPGNIYVALAKKACFGHVSIDSIAGPSEILVLADDTADARYVAADLLSQAEHDEMASAILITTSRSLAEKVSKEIDVLVQSLERKDIIRKSLDQYGCIFVASSMEEAIDAVNEIASEHLEILTENPFDTMTRIKNAGAIFLGPYSSEPLGDYYAGPNHILPTNRTARFFSPLSVDDFIKKTSIISYSREALEAVHEDIERFAAEEGLTAHAHSIRVRFD